MAPWTSQLGEYSANWRKAVRARWAAKHASQAFARTLKPGDLFLGGGRNCRCVEVRKNWIIGLSPVGTFKYRRDRIGPPADEPKKVEPVTDGTVAVEV